MGKREREHIPVEEDGDEVFIPFKDVRCWAFLSCGGAKLVKKRHDSATMRGLWWRCPKCGGYYGEAKRTSGEGIIK